MRVPTWPRRAVALAAAVTMAAACGGDDGGTTAATTTSTPATTATTVAGDTTASTAGTTASTATTATTAPPAGTVVEVTVADGAVAGPGTAAVDLDDEVVLRVTSDVADEVHVHGYDLTAAVAAGATAELTFTADLPGVFEVELEGAGLPLVELEVS